MIVVAINLPPGIQETSWDIFVISTLWIAGSAAANPSRASVPVGLSQSIIVTCSGTAGQCPSGTLSQNQCVYIDKTPQLPALTAKIVNQDGTPASGSVTYNLTGTFVQTIADQAVTQNWIAAPQPPPIVGASTPSTVPWIYFRGGQASLNWNYNGANGSPFNFCIRAMNPDLTTVQSAVASVPYWFAPNIGVHETNLSQFCDGTSRTNVGQYCNNTNVGMPVFWHPGGYGIFQFDPPPSLDEIWNWTANVAYDTTYLSNVSGPEHETNQNLAYPFWIKQVHQWQDYNANQITLGKRTALPPPNQNYWVGEQFPVTGLPPGGATITCTFTLSQAPAPQYTKRITGSAAYWFGDAIAMKRVAGAPQLSGQDCGDYICWDNTPSVPVPFWAFFPANTNKLRYRGRVL